jgi:hypothetical protein
VLQIVPHAAIPLLQPYSEGGGPDCRLEPLIPALGLIFRVSDRNNPTSVSRKLCSAVSDRAQTVYEQLVNKRTVVKQPLPLPAAPTGNYWEDLGSY